MNVHSMSGAPCGACGDLDGCHMPNQPRRLTIRQSSAHGAKSYHKDGQLFPLGETLSKVANEVARGRSKFPGNRFMLAALTEEVGELAYAIMAGDNEAIVREAAQVAAVAIRIAEEGDAATYEPLGFGGLVYAVGEMARNLMQRKPLLVLRALDDALNRIRSLRAGEDETFSDVTDEEAQP